MTQQGNNIYFQWDEENRLKGVTKPALGSCYFYDASGERYYKNYGERIFMLVNGSFYMKIPYYLNPVLYASPYMVVTPSGYTKHYFVENERFASRIGDGNITGLNSHATTNAALVAKQAVVDFYAPDSIPPGQFYNFRTLPAHWSSRHTTYWQHSDHLGSASWVTDTTGRGYEHFQYNAWGGPFITQRITGGDYQSRYTFSGKERDEETGYSYFGARYYNSDLSIWLSVDPLADKYPGVSPYTYCGNNPVRFFDPNGREKIDALGNDPQNKKNKQACANYKDNKPVIHLWAHGYSHAIETHNPVSNERKIIRNASDMRDFLCLHSVVYQENDDHGKTSILVLHSCNTGQGEDNIAQKISAELDLLVVAPNDELWGDCVFEGTPKEYNYEIGVNHLYQKKGVDGKDEKYVGKRGAWIIYYKGVQVDSFDGHSRPNFSNPQKTIEKYEKKYQSITSKSE